MLQNIIKSFISNSLIYSDNLGKNKINNLILLHPFLSAVLLGGFKNGIIDLSMQYFTNNKKSINWKRVGLFAIFGFIYTGGGQYILFNKIFPRILPGGINYGTVKKGLIGGVILDNFIHMPFIYMPTFYCMREYTYSNNINNAINNGLVYHKNFFIEDVTMQACIFIPFQTFNLGFNPPHLRIPALCVASTLWVSILSFYRGDKKGFK